MIFFLLEAKCPLGPTYQNKLLFRHHFSQVAKFPQVLQTYKETLCISRRITYDGTVTWLFRKGERNTLHHFEEATRVKYKRHTIQVESY